MIKQQHIDSDSDLDDFNYVINESERQLIKVRQILNKKQRFEHAISLSNDHFQRKYVKLHEK